MRILRLGLIGMLFAFASLGAARAQSGYDEGEWRFTLAPYLWLPVKTTGESTVDGITAPVDLSISDTIEIADKLFGLAGRVEAWYDRYGVVVEGYYFALQSKEFSTLIPGPFPVLPGATLTGSVNLTQAWVNFLPAVHLGDWKIDDRGAGVGGFSPTVWLEPMAGFRYGYIKQEVDLFLQPGLGFIPARAGTAGGSHDYVEPVIAGRLGVDFAEEWTFLLYGDVGGFGVGNGSELTWTFLAGFHWSPWENTSIEFGYRLYDIDYTTGSGSDEFGYNMFQHGPQIGVVFRF